MGPATPSGSTQENIPVLDSPKTPDTPTSQVEIGPAVLSAPSTPHAVSGGRWGRYESSVAPLYSPPSVEVAKRFLRFVSGSAQQLPPRPVPRRIVRQPSSDTPVSRHQYKPSSPEMICHGCHGPIGSGLHKGSATGKINCTLLHSYSCPGGIIEDDSWRSCPEDFVPGIFPGDTGFENTLGESAFQAPNGVVGSTPAAYRDSPIVSHQTLAQLEDLSQQPLLSQTQGLAQQPHSSIIPNQLPPTLISTSPGQVPQHVLDEVRLHRQAHGEGARARVIQDRIPSRMMGSLSQRSRGSGNLSELEQEEAALRARNQQQEMNAVQQSQRQQVLTIKDIRSIPGMRSEVESHVDMFRTMAPVLGHAPSALPPGLPAPQLGAQPSQLADMVAGMQLGTDQGQAQELASLQAKYAAVVHQRKLAARQLEQTQLQQEQVAARQQQHQLQQQLAIRQQQAHDRAAAEITQYRRKIAEVESELRNAEQALQHQTYPVNTAPRVTTAQTVTPQDNAGVAGEGVSSLYEYLQGSDGRQYRVLKSAAIPVTPVQQAPSTRLEYRCSPTSGRLYQVRVPVIPQVCPTSSSLSPCGQYTWQRDPRTGLLYQTLVSQDQGVGHQSLPGPSVQQPWQPQQLQGRHQVADTPAGQHLSGHVSQQQVQGQQQLSGSYSENIQERVKGITNLSEWEGGAKKPKLIDYVKRCPVKWAQQVKPDTMNIPVYAWGAVTEIIESLSGRTESLSEAELLGKLQHMQGVFEVCCINSTPVEYNSYGWTLARHYASKVQAKVDKGLLKWDTLQPGIQTADLVAAQMEYPKPPEKKAPTKKPEDEKQMCHTYNTCNIEGKCDYEVSNPGRSCQRRHECSWCRKNLSKGYRHQVWKCIKKTESEQ